MKRQTLIGLLLSTVLLYLAGTLFVCKVLRADRAPAEVDSGVGVELASGTATTVAIEDAGKPAPVARALPGPGVLEAVQLTTALAPTIPADASATTSLPETTIPPAPDPVPSRLEPRASLLHPEPAETDTVRSAVAVGAGWQREVRVVHRLTDEVETADGIPQQTAEPPIGPPTPTTLVPTLPAVKSTVHSKSRPQPLTGVHPCDVDENHALTLPAAVREQLGSSLPRKLFLTPGPDCCLWVYTAEGLDRLAERLEHSRSDRSSAQAFRRLYFAHTEAGRMDREGGLVIPEHLAHYAGLRKEVVVIGAHDHFEIWNAQHWQRYLDCHVPHTKPGLTP